MNIAVRNTAAWHPDTRASLAFATAAMLLVMTGFVALFAASPKLKLFRDTEGVTEQVMLTEPTPTLPLRRPHNRVAAPIVRLPLLQPAPPISPLPLSLPLPNAFTIQDYLDERQQQDAATLRDKVTAGGLQRNLGKTGPKAALSDSQGYRTAGGQKMVRSGDDCAQIQVVQGSSSPTNRAYVAEPTDCPGATPDAGREMGKALADWANKVRQSQPPPGE